MQIKHGNISAMGNSVRGFMNTQEDTRREGGANGYQVGPASPTVAPAGPPALGFGAPFRKLPPPPLRSHLGPWLSWFDPTACPTPTGL